MRQETHFVSVNSTTWMVRSRSPETNIYLSGTHVTVNAMTHISHAKVYGLAR